MSRLVFGVQPVREVLRAHGNRVAGLWLVDPMNPKVAGLERLAAARGVAVEKATRLELDRRTKGGMHQGAVALAPELDVLDHERFMKRLADAPWAQPSALDEAPGAVAADSAGQPAAGDPPVVVILDGIMDPQNFGAVVRSSVALGAPFVVWPEHGSAPLTPATFRASAGAVEHATLVRVPSLPPLIHDLKQLGFTVVLLEGGSEAALESVPLHGPVAIVVGAEDKGAKPAVRRAATVRAHVPMSRAIDSLNASVACALALYEVGRQRRLPK